MFSDSSGTCSRKGNSRPAPCDLEGIVAKWKDCGYIADDRRSSWVKVKNPNYSQIEGRAEMFDELR